MLIILAPPVPNLTIRMTMGPLLKSLHSAGLNQAKTQVCLRSKFHSVSLWGITQASGKGNLLEVNTSSFVLLLFISGSTTCHDRSFKHLQAYQRSRLISFLTGNTTNWTLVCAESETAFVNFPNNQHQRTNSPKYFSDKAPQAGRSQYEGLYISQMRTSFIPCGMKSLTEGISNA